MVSNIEGVHIVGGKSHSFPQSVLMRQSYAIVVSVHAQKHNIHIYTYITTYLPNDTRAFNTARTVLHTSQ
jgi:uncharacterized membrane protein